VSPLAGLICHNNIKTRQDGVSTKRVAPRKSLDLPILIDRRNRQAVSRRVSCSIHCWDERSGFVVRMGENVSNTKGLIAFVVRAILFHTARSR
jgi:hypothetical protein